MLGSCPLWTSFEQVTWGILFYPNKGSLGHLLQHENSSTGLNKRRLINLKVDSCKSTYLSLGLSFLLPTGICLSMFFFNFYRPTYLLSTCTILYRSYYPSTSRSISIFFVFFPLSFVCPPIYLIYLIYQIHLIHLIYQIYLFYIHRSIDLFYVFYLFYRSIEKNFSIDLSISLFYSVLCYSILSVLVYSILF